MLFSTLRPTRSLTAKSLVMALAVLMTACGGASSDSSVSAAAQSDETSQNQAETGSTGAASVGDDMVLGAADAPVTVIEYASVTCPGCASFHATTFPALKEKYIDSGQVKLIFREFPTPPVDFSYIGSVLARCAGEKNGAEAYFVVIDALLKNQRTWIYGDDPKLELLKIAGQAGMDEPAFDACLARQDIIDAMNERIEEGRTKFNIQSTPSFVVDGEPTRFGNQDAFFAILDEKLGIQPDSEADGE